MPVVIDDLHAEITPEAESPGGAAGTTAGASGDAGDPGSAAQTTQTRLLAWQALRDLAAEREARLAID